MLQNPVAIACLMIQLLASIKNLSSSFSLSTCNSSPIEISPRHLMRQILTEHNFIVFETITCQGFQGLFALL